MKQGALMKQGARFAHARTLMVRFGLLTFFTPTYCNGLFATDCARNAKLRFNL